MLRRLRPAAVVATLGGLALGLLLGLGFGRSFDAGFRTGLVGALVGGVLAIVGSYLGSKELIDRDADREQRDLIGAVQATRSEMSTNNAVVQDLIARGFGNFANAMLYDGDYRQVITTLARGLPMDLFAELSVTENGVRRAADFLGYDQGRGGGIRSDTIAELKLVAEHLPRVNKTLLDYTRDVLKVDVPDLVENPFGDGTDATSARKGSAPSGH